MGDTVWVLRNNYEWFDMYPAAQTEKHCPMYAL